MSPCNHFLKEVLKGYIRNKIVSKASLYSLMCIQCYFMGTGSSTEFFVLRGIYVSCGIPLHLPVQIFCLERMTAIWRCHVVDVRKAELLSSGPQSWVLQGSMCAEGK